jgi:hypothetical protein
LIEEVVPRASVLPTRTRLGETQTGKAALAACAPVPDREIVAGEFVALLVSVAVPVTLPVADGANVTFKVADCPGVSVVPVDTPLTLNPAPETETFEIETFELPEFFTVIGRELLEPVFTLPKLKLLGEAVS